MSDDDSFAMQIEKVLNGTFPRYSALKVCDTPKILINVGCEPLPMLYTQRHLKNALKAKNYKHNEYHGLTIENMKKIPELVREPVLIFDSLSKQDTIVLVTNELDIDNAPIIVSIKPNGQGVYEISNTNSNFITSIYGKDNGFKDYIDEAINKNKLLFFDKEKSQQLFSVLQLQLPQGLNNFDSNNIIRQSNNIVNQNKGDLNMTYKKRLTPEEKEERKRQLQEQVKDIVDNFNNSPETIIDFIKFNSQFHQYSTNNTMLIYEQNNMARFCASYKTFKDMGYQVQKGQKGMKIFVPYITTLWYDTRSEQWKKISEATKEEKALIKSGEVESRQISTFGIGTVFDIGQTDCPPEEYPKICDMGFSSRTYRELYNAVINYAQSKEIAVSEQFFPSITTRGYYDSRTNEIVLSDKLNDSMKLSVMCHELAHGLMHNKPEAKEIPTEQKEIEADSLSLMLRNHLDITEVEDVRQNHLQTSYKAYLEWAETNKDNMHCPSLSEILDNVNNTYSAMIDDFNNSINHYFELHPEQQLSQSGETTQDVMQHIQNEFSIVDTYEDASDIPFESTDGLNEQHHQMWQAIHEFESKNGVPQEECLVEMNKFGIAQWQPKDNITPEQIEAAYKDILNEESVMSLLKSNEEYPENILQDQALVKWYSFASQINDDLGTKKALQNILKNDMQIVAINSNFSDNYSVINYEGEIQNFKTKTEAMSFVLSNDNIVKLVDLYIMQRAILEQSYLPLSEAANLKYPYIKIEWSENSAINHEDRMLLKDAEKIFLSQSEKNQSDGIIEKTSFSLFLAHDNIYHITADLGADIGNNNGLVGHISQYLKDVQENLSDNESLKKLQQYIKDNFTSNEDVLNELSRQNEINDTFMI